MNDPAVIYYVEETESWTRLVNGAIEVVSDDIVKEVIETNAYIDNPANTPYLFLYPRDIYVGLQFSIDL